jgi:hypothetical protein
MKLNKSNIRIIKRIALSLSLDDDDDENASIAHRNKGGEEIKVAAVSDVECGTYLFV